MYVAISAEPHIDGVDILNCYGPFNTPREAAEQVKFILIEDGDYDGPETLPTGDALVARLEHEGWHFIEVEYVEPQVGTPVGQELASHDAFIAELPTVATEQIPPKPYMTRSPKFNENVRGGDLEELIELACPYCGHTTPDHRWNRTFDCLMRPCDCNGWLSMDELDGMFMLNTGELFVGPGPDSMQLEAALRSAFGPTESENREIYGK